MLRPCEITAEHMTALDASYSLAESTMDQLNAVSAEFEILTEKVNAISHTMTLMEATEDKALGGEESKKNFKAWVAKAVQTIADLIKRFGEIANRFFEDMKDNVANMADVKLAEPVMVRLLAGLNAGKLQLPNLNIKVDELAELGTKEEKFMSITGIPFEGTIAESIAKSMGCDRYEERKIGSTRLIGEILKLAKKTISEFMKTSNIVKKQAKAIAEKGDKSIMTIITEIVNGVQAANKKLLANAKSAIGVIKTAAKSEKEVNKAMKKDEKKAAKEDKKKEKENKKKDENLNENTITFDLGLDEDVITENTDDGNKNEDSMSPEELLESWSTDENQDNDDGNDDILNFKI